MMVLSTFIVASHQLGRESQCGIVRIGLACGHGCGDLSKSDPALWGWCYYTREETGCAEVETSS